MQYRTLNPATEELIETFSEVTDAAVEESLEESRKCGSSSARHRS